MVESVSTKADVVRLALAVLGTVKIVLGAFGITIPQELIDNLADLAGLVFVIVGIVKHNFFGKKGKEQKLALKKHELL